MALTLVVQVIGAVCVQEHAIGIILSLCQRKRHLKNFALQYLRALLPPPTLWERRGPKKLQTQTLLRCGPASTYHKINWRTVMNLWPQRATVVSWYGRPSGHSRLNIRRC